ncbi:MAG TPA: BON domain-containing protein, partial [Phycisphaerales bacterium]|nr:BON domain-containing protein [Phycisphaerales bacterium]
DGSIRNADGSIRTAAPSMPEARDNRNLPNEKPTKPDAVDQSNKQADLDVTQAIRKAVLARDGMSMGAKNITIVTEMGTVTLKGEVASDTEKTTIGEIATANAAGRTVDNQLTVKPAQ